MSATTDKSRKHLLPKAERHLLTGLTLMKKNLCSDALTHFRHAFQFSDSKTDISVSIQNTLYRRVITHYSNLDLRVLLVQVHLLSGSYRDALDEIEDLIDMDPQFGESYDLLHKIHLKAVYHDEVERLFELALFYGYFAPVVIDTLSSIYLRRNDYQKGISLYEALLSKSPDNHGYYRPLAELYSRMGQLDAACGVYERFLDSAPYSAAELLDHLSALMRQNAAHLPLRKLLIRICFQLFKPQDGISHMRDLFLHHPDAMGDMIDTLKRALDSFPHSFDVLLALSDALITSGHYSEAVQYLQEIYDHCDPRAELILRLREILELFPEQILALQLLGEVFLEDGQFDDALECYQSLIQLRQSNLRDIESQIQRFSGGFSPRQQHYSQLLIARIKSFSGRTQDALSDCEALLETDLRLSSRLLQSDIYSGRGNFEKSRSILIASLQTDSTEWVLHQKLRDQLDKEIQTRVDTLSDVVSKGSNADLSQVFQLGISYLAQGSFYKAVEQFQKIDESNSLARETFPLMGRCFMEMGRYDLSINQFQKILTYMHELEKDEINRWHYMIGLNFLLQGKIQHSLHNLELVMQSDMTFEKVAFLVDKYKTDSFLDLRGKAVCGCLSRPQKLLGLSSFVMRNLENDTVFDDGNSYQPLSFSHTHNNQGVDYLLSQNYSSAEEEFRLAIQMDPKMTIAHVNLAYLLVVKGRLDEAKECLSTAQALNSNIDLIHVIYGLIDLLSGAFDSGISQFQNALSLNPKNTLVFMCLGDAYFQKQDLKTAFEYWERAHGSERFFYLLQRRSRYLAPECLSSNYWTHHFETHFNPSDSRD